MKRRSCLTNIRKLSSVYVLAHSGFAIRCCPMVDSQLILELLFLYILYRNLKFTSSCTKRIRTEIERAVSYTCDTAVHAFFYKEPTRRRPTYLRGSYY